MSLKNSLRIPFQPEEITEETQVAFLRQLMRRLNDRFARASNTIDLNEGQAQFVDALPTAELANRGKIVVVLNEGTPGDRVYICIQNSALGFDWQEVSWV